MSEREAMTEGAKRDISFLKVIVACMRSNREIQFEIGEVEKAKQVLNRFKESSAGPSLDISRIEEVLNRASASAPAHTKTLSAEAGQQLLQFALSLADRTL